MNFYESRYLHLNLKAFLGKLNFDENITIFIDEDRRVKNSEINYFDHPNMGLIIKVDKTGKAKKYIPKVKKKEEKK